MTRELYLFTFKKPLIKPELKKLLRDKSTNFTEFSKYFLGNKLAGIWFEFLNKMSILYFNDSFPLISDHLCLHKFL